MKYRAMGRRRLELSALSLGGWRTFESNLRAVDLALPGHVRDAIETIFPVEVTA